MKMHLSSHWIICTVISFYLFASTPHIFAREFTSIDGKKMEATVVSVKGLNVVLKRGTKQFTVPVNRFSLEDQSFLKKMADDAKKNIIPKLKIDINNGKSNRADKDDSYDDRKGSFHFSVKITNDEIHYNLKDSVASLSVIGLDCDNDKKYGVMQKESFKVNAAPGKNFAWKGNALNYKFDDHTPVTWGCRYYGYVFQIKTADGKIIFTKASQKKFEPLTDKILDLSLYAGFDKNVKPLGQIRIHTN